MTNYEQDALDLIPGETPKQKFENLKAILSQKDAKPTISEAMEVLKEELLKGEGPDSYYFGWQANIAMSMVDAVNSAVDETITLETANKAAKQFLWLLTK